MGNQFSKAHRPKLTTSSPPAAGGEQGYIDLVTAAGPLATHNITHTPEVFDGATRYQIGDASVGADIATAGQVTYEGIASLNGLTADQTLIGALVSPTRQGLLYFDEGSTPNFRALLIDSTNGNMGVTPVTPTGYSVTIGVEYHVVYTYDGTTAKLYIDGVERESVLDSETLKDPGLPYYVGDNGNGNMYLDGTGRGFAIYDRALSAAEVAAHHAAAFDFDVGSSPEVGAASRSFDGVDDYIDTNSETIAGGLFAEAGNPFSVSCWVKVVSHTGAHRSFVAREGATVGDIFNLRIGSPNRVQVYFRGQQLSPVISFPEGEWVHVVAVYDENNIALFQNGVEISSAIFSGTGVNTTGRRVFLGRRQNLQHPFAGSLSDVRFYNRALSSGEIQDLYNGEDITNGLDAQYLGNEDNVLDLTGNGNDATNNGSTFVADDGPFPDIPTRDDVVRNNVFTSSNSGIQAISASGETTVYEAWKACDGINDFPNCWISANGQLNWWQIDFGENQVIHSVEFACRGFDRDNIADFEIQSSDDGATWTTRLIGERTETSDEVLQSHDLTSPAAARYWRLQILSDRDPSNDRGSLTEIYWKS